jgi:hypothetical protein
MNAFMDTIWEKIAAAAIALAAGFDTLLMSFDFMGPAALVCLLALLTVLVTKSLNRLIITKRYIELEKNFNHWHDLRQTAMQCEDREKGKALAKNIDQAELNRAYYDYFFEGLLLGLVRKLLPVFIVLSYINEYFQPIRLTERFGRSYIFKFDSSSADPIVIGAVLWYIIALLSTYLGWYLLKTVFKLIKNKADPLSAEPTSEPA